MCRSAKRRTPIGAGLAFSRSGSAALPVNAHAPSFQAFSTPGLAAILSPLPLALFFILTFGMHKAAYTARRCDGRRLLALAASLCMGVLAWCPITLLLPLGLASMPWMRQMAPIFCLLCLSLAIAPKRRPSPMQSGIGAKAPSGKIAALKHQSNSPITRKGPDRCSVRPRLSSPITIEKLHGLLAEAELARLSSRGLTSRELDVFCSYVTGMSSTQAGRLLGISDKTVREYWRRCRVKLDVNGLDEVAPKWREHDAG